MKEKITGGLKIAPSKLVISPISKFSKLRHDKI